MKKRSKTWFWKLGRCFQVWNVNTGRCIHTLTGHTNRVYSLLVSQLDAYFFVAVGFLFDFDKICLSVFNVFCIVFLGNTYCTACSLRIFKKCYALQFDSERDIVVSGSLDTTIRVWNIYDGVCIQALIGHQSLTSGMQLRGNILVSGNADSTIKVSF